MLIGTERVVSAGGNERRVTFPKRQLLSVYFEHPASFEDDVDLAVCVYALMVWLRRDKRVDADLKPPRFVDGLVPTVGGAEACFCSSDIERHEPNPLRGRAFMLASRRRIALGESHAQRMNHAAAVSNRVAHPFTRVELLNCSSSGV